MNGLPEADGAQMRKIGVVTAFIVLCATIFTFLWVSSGGKIPLANRGDYQVEADFSKVANLVYFSDVMVAGVKVGKVTQVEARGDHAHVVMKLRGDVAPLHDGAKVVVRAKSLVEESYIQVIDGKGAELPSGTSLPTSASTAATKLSDVLQSFDRTTRDRVGQLVRSGGLATDDTRTSVEGAMAGLGNLGREGLTVTDAIAAQSDDLKELTRSSTRVLATLDARREELRSLIASADQVTAATAGQQQDIRNVVRALPPLLDAAAGSGDDLQRLGVALTPVADNLAAAAPDLAAALTELPASSRELRATMPSLDSLLGKAPATLKRLPRTAGDLRTLLPDADVLLADANPMLAYLAPYDRDVASFFANFAAVLASGDNNGHFLRIMPGFNEQSFKGFPVSTNIGPLNRKNPLPAPGSLQHPRPYSGTYPHVGGR